MISFILISIHTLFATISTDTTHYQLIVGSYTAKGNSGIEVFDVNGLTGASSPVYQLKNKNASYLTVTPNGEYMYAVSEDDGGDAKITSYHKNSNHVFSFINSTPTIGAAPCFVTYRKSSQTVYTANYTGGSLSVFKTKDGELLPISQHIVYSGSSINKSRQMEPHAHNVVLSPDEQFLYVTDLGTDNIYQHKVNKDGTVSVTYKKIKINAGNGPRHLVFDKSGTRMYLVSELKGLVDVYHVAGDKLTNVQTIVTDTSKVKDDKASADIHISSNGKWLLVSNRITSDDIAVFKILPDGRLEAHNHQPVAKMPRNFTFDPSGKLVFVASQTESRVQVFSFDDYTGKLLDLHKDITVSMPVCLTFVKG